MALRKAILSLALAFAALSPLVARASPLGLERAGAPAFGTLALESRGDVVVDRTIPLVVTKASSARNHCRGAMLPCAAFNE